MKEIKSIAGFIQNKRILFLSLIFITCIGFHFFWAVKAVGDGKFFLLNEDEVIYYCSAKVFSATNSVQAESCIDENVSRIGNMNWYGPGYNVVYGSLFKIVDHHASIPWFHFTLAMGLLGLLFLLPVGLDSRLLVAIALSVTQHFCVYIYTYFPETLILFLATILTVLLARLYFTKDEKSRKIYLITFIACTLLFMLCRVTFIFWLAGLIALAENKRDRNIRIAIFSIGVLMSLVYMKLFTAPPYADQMHKIDLLFKGEILSFIRQTKRSIFESIQIVLTNKSFSVMQLLALIGVSLITFFFEKNKLILASLLISLCLLSSMFAFYSVDEFYFTKQTAMLVPLIIVCLAVAINYSILKYGLVVILISAFPVSYKKTNAAIALGQQGYDHYNNNKALETAFGEIPQHIQDEKTLILYCYREYDYGSSAEALLPFSTRAKQPIMYTTGIVDPNEVAESKFVLHNKMKVDYILSRHSISWPNLKQVHQTEFYHLYKLLE